MPLSTQMPDFKSRAIAALQAPFPAGNVFTSRASAVACLDYDGSRYWTVQRTTGNATVYRFSSAALAVAFLASLS